MSMYVYVDTIDGVSDDFDPMDQCAPCESCHPELTAMKLTFTIIKALISAAVIAWPAYKTYKAIESNNLRHCQAMLVFWAVTCIVNSFKEFSDDTLGKYSNFYLWKGSILCLKLLPTLLTPDWIYSHLVAPFFASHQKSIDTAVQIAQTTKQSVMELPKEGVEKTKEKLAEVKEMTQEKLEEVKEKMMLASEGLKERLEEMGNTIKETLSPSLSSRRLGGSPSGSDGDEDLVEVDANGEQVETVKLRQRKPWENREHLRKLSLTRSQSPSSRASPDVVAPMQKTEMMSEREKAVVEELQQQVAVTEEMQAVPVTKGPELVGLRDWEMTRKEL